MLKYYVLWDNLYFVTSDTEMFILFKENPPKYGLIKENQEHYDMMTKYGEPSTKEVFEKELGQTDDQLFILSYLLRAGLEKV